jgi:hypothetical protein
MAKKSPKPASGSKKSAKKPRASIKDIPESGEMSEEQLGKVSGGQECKPYDYSKCEITGTTTDDSVLTCPTQKC